MKRDCLKHFAATAALLLVAGSANAYDAFIDGLCYNLVAKAKQATVTSSEDDNIKYEGEVVIPSTITYNDVTYDVTAIGNHAFNSCTGISSLTIPTSVTTIGECAFLACTGLTSVTIPSSVTSIGGSAFYGCQGLTSIEIPSSVTKIEDYVFYECSSLTAVTIPENVTRIQWGAFYGCTGLTSVTIPSNVDEICGSSFSNCTGLTSVTIKKGVTYIRDSAFANCTNLTSVTIEGSEVVDAQSFYGCSKLTTITLNGGNIHTRSFANCPELMDVYCYSEYPPSIISSDAFEGSYIEYVTLHVPVEYISNYTNDSFWGSSFKEIVTIEPVEYPTSIALTDGETFEGYPVDVDMEEITYTRTFSNNNWQALYVPFTMAYSEWAADFDIARINDIHQFDDDDNGTIDRTELEVIKVTSGSIEANTPYLIRAKEAGEKTFTLANRTLYKAEEKSYTVSSWNTLFTFTGTYSGVTGSDMVNNAYYALGDGALRQAASIDNALSPYRWYVAITDRNGAQKDVNEVKLKVWGEDATGIDLTPAFSQGEGETSVYDLSGRRVEKATKGLYIVNGKKMMVR